MSQESCFVVKHYHQCGSVIRRVEQVILRSSFLSSKYQVKVLVEEVCEKMQMNWLVSRRIAETKERRRQKSKG